MPTQSEPPASLAASLRSSWHGFLDTYEPLRSQLYRYCRHLTRSAWDAEDLAQEAMARAFVTLGQMGDAPPNPRASLLLDTAAVEVVGATTQYGELVAHRGAWVFVHWYAHDDGEAVRAITRVELDGDRVAHLRNHFFSPDFIAEVCGELGLPWRSNGYRWSTSACPGDPTPTEDRVADSTTAATR